MLQMRCSIFMLPSRPWSFSEPDVWLPGPRTEGRRRLWEGQHPRLSSNHPEPHWGQSLHCGRSCHWHSFESGEVFSAYSSNTNYLCYFSFLVVGDLVSQNFGGSDRKPKSIMECAINEIRFIRKLYCSWRRKENKKINCKFLSQISN